MKFYMHTDFKKLEGTLPTTAKVQFWDRGVQDQSTTRSQRSAEHSRQEERSEQIAVYT